VIFTLFSLQITASDSLSLIVNIITRGTTNGAGREVDISILKGELERLGHHANIFDVDISNSITSADINLFLTSFNSEWCGEAKLNWYIPNAETCAVTLNDLKKIDLVLCKTEECLRIFQPIIKKTYYLGFTSFDHYQPSLSKDFSKYLHVAGKSTMKGTQSVIDVWAENREFPELVLVTRNKWEDIPKNIKLIYDRVPEDSLLKLQNSCGIHLCPSESEGFGHYMMEAMSAGAVVITTDAPPMNEFIKDPRCLVKYEDTESRHYATLYLVDEQDLEDKVLALQQIPIKELKKIGKHNRKEYLRRKAEFTRNFENLMHKTVHDFNQ
jgi:glycosyltransferase involved in cell wall biosynthesis